MDKKATFGRYSGQERIDHYKSVHWDNFFTTNGALLEPGSGYENGATSGTEVAYNAFGNPADIDTKGSFTFKSVELTAAWDSTMIVDITGMRDGVQIYEQQVTINDRSPTLVSLDWQGVDDVKFTPVSGEHDPKQSGKGLYIAFDDVIIADRVYVNPAVTDTLPDNHRHVDLSALPHPIA